MKTSIQSNQTIISFDGSLCFGCKHALWKACSKQNQVQVGYFVNSS
jgi:hypothetical protein